MLTNELAIGLKGVSKHYHTHDDTSTLLKAVDDITLNIQKGSMIGFVGKNGCGKSTLLKMIAGITKPTAGTIELCGPLMAFTDFGAGFHPDLSGLENVYLAGRLYGLKKAQITDLLPQIISFSELEKFLYMPVKNYSQGMFLRLAFSIMIHLPLEIVLLDEALAVGDEAFRQKCFSKISDLIANGLTILIVSHNYQEIAGMCSRCIVMEQGKIIADGRPEEVYNAYVGSIPMNTLAEVSNRADIETHFNLLKPGFINLLSVTVRHAEHPEKRIDFASPIVISIVWEKLVKEGSVFFDLISSDEKNIPFLATANYYGKPIDVVQSPNEGKTGRFTSECFIPPYFLNHGLVNFTFLGTIFLSRNVNYTIFNTTKPLRVMVQNAEDLSHRYYWIDSNAPVRTALRWAENEITDSIFNPHQPSNTPYVSRFEKTKGI